MTEDLLRRIVDDVFHELKDYAREQVDREVEQIPYTIQQELLGRHLQHAIQAFIAEEVQKQIVVSVSMRDKS